MGRDRHPAVRRRLEAPRPLGLLSSEPPPPPEGARLVDADQHDVLIPARRRIGIADDEEAAVFHLDEIPAVVIALVAIRLRPDNLPIHVEANQEDIDAAGVTGIGVADGRVASLRKLDDGVADVVPGAAETMFELDEFLLVLGEVYRWESQRQSGQSQYDAA